MFKLKTEDRSIRKTSFLLIRSCVISVIIVNAFWVPWYLMKNEADQVFKDQCQGNLLCIPLYRGELKTCNDESIAHNFSFPRAVNFSADEKALNEEPKSQSESDGQIWELDEVGFRLQIFDGEVYFSRLLLSMKASK